MRYSLILWDFDGTLVDSLSGAVGVYNELAQEHGYPQVNNLDEVRDGTVLQFLRTHHIPLWRVPRLRREFLKRQGQLLKTTPLISGLRQSLHQFRDQGVRLGVVSSNSEENIRSCLTANQAETLFDFVVGYARLSGKRRVLRQVLRHEQVDFDRVLYVGDEVRDIQAAHRVGVDVAAVTWGFQVKSILANHAPTHIVDEPGQLPAILLTDEIVE